MADSELWKALLAVQREVRTIHKGSWNDHGKYKYLSADQAISEARPLLTKHGLVFRAASCKYVGEMMEVVDSRNRPQVMRTIEGTFHLVHAETGQMTTWSVEMAVTSKAGTPLDKATLAGRTELINYALRDLLLFDRGDEDVSGRKDEDEEVKTMRVTMQSKNREIAALRQELGMTSEEALELCVEVTGKKPSEKRWTIADADALIEHLKNEKIRREVRGE